MRRCRRAGILPGHDSLDVRRSVPPLVRTLDDRGVRIFAIAKATCIPIQDLHRLMEIGSPLTADEAARLTSWGARMLVISRPRPRLLPGPIRPVSIPSAMPPPGKNGRAEARHQFTPS